MPLQSNPIQFQPPAPLNLQRQNTIPQTIDQLFNMYMQSKMVNSQVALQQQQLSNAQAQADSERAKFAMETGGLTPQEIMSRRQLLGGGMPQQAPVEQSGPIGFGAQTQTFPGAMGQESGPGGGPQHLGGGNFDDWIGRRVSELGQMRQGARTAAAARGAAETENINAEALKRRAEAGKMTAEIGDTDPNSPKSRAAQAAYRGTLIQAGVDPATISQIPASAIKEIMSGNISLQNADAQRQLAQNEAEGRNQILAAGLQKTFLGAFGKRNRLIDKVQQGALNRGSSKDIRTTQSGISYTVEP